MNERSIWNLLYSYDYYFAHKFIHLFDLPTDVGDSKPNINKNNNIRNIYIRCSSILYINNNEDYISLVTNYNFFK